MSDIRYYTAEEVANRYGVKLRTVWTWIRESKLNAHRLGGRIYRISEQDLTDFESESKKSASQAD